MKHELEFFPDGTPIDDWFYEIETPELSALGKQYPLTDYGILPDGQLHTRRFSPSLTLQPRRAAVFW